MIIEEIVEELYTQDPSKELTLKIESIFEGVREYKVVDLEGTELKVELIDDASD